MIYWNIWFKFSLAKARLKSHEKSNQLTVRLEYKIIDIVQLRLSSTTVLSTVVDNSIKYLGNSIKCERSYLHFMFYLMFYY